MKTPPYYLSRRPVDNVNKFQFYKPDVCVKVIPMRFRFIIVLAVVFSTAVGNVFAQTNQEDTADIADRIADRISNMDDAQLEKMLDSLHNDLEHFSLSDTTNAYHLIATEQDLNAAISKLQQEKADTETGLKSAKTMLTNVEQKIQLLHLQPSQLKAIEDYNKSVNQEPASFWDWFTERRTIYELVAAVLIAAISFGAGATWDVLRESKHKRKTVAHKKELS